MNKQQLEKQKEEEEEVHLLCDDPIKSNKFPTIGNPGGPGIFSACLFRFRRDNLK